MTVAEERRTLYRARVLTAAEREFARAGFADAKVTAIARGAELSLATVYKTFSGKEEIWNELHAERMTALVAQVDERVRDVASPLDRLLAGIATVAEFLTEHDGYLELNLRASSGWVGVEGGTEVQRTVWAAGLDMIAAGVEAARGAGETTDLRTRVATGLVVSALQVWLADWVESGRDREPREVVDELVAHLRLALTSAQEAPAR